MECPESSIDWFRVWRNIAYSSQNLNIKVTNLTFLYCMFMTQKGHFMIKISSSPNCNLCSLNQLGTFLHVMWECPLVQSVCQQIVKHLANAFGLEIDLTPRSMLLNDDSGQDFNHMQRMSWLSACIVA